MLTELTIENMAVIEKATVPFGPGLNVLTGETGAGKSILIDSINAILGNRTSRDLVRTGAAKASVWALFSNLGPAAAKQVEQAGYSLDDGQLLLMRQIGADGKSSCRINGQPATAAVLKQIGQSLLNIHGQHDNQTLLCPEKHLSVLDAYAQNEQLRRDYYESYRVLRDIVRQIQALSMDDAEKQRRMDLLRYETDEIETAQLWEGEEEALTEERDKIRSAERILQALGMAQAALEGAQGDQPGAVELLENASRPLDEIAEISKEYRQLTDRAGELYYAAQEFAADIGTALDTFDYDGQRLEEVEERLDLIHRLERKYGESVSKVLEYGQKAAAELEQISFCEEKLDELHAQRADALKGARAKADALTKNRKEAFERFAGQIAQSLAFLNMPGIRLALSYTQGKLSSTGQDEVEFLISTNPGEPPKPLSRIASGGELSRIMLAIKSAMADRDEIDTVIYDEIDTGVSGLAAGRIGSKLKETSTGRQVICVTHTAQIAAQADEHLFIAKQVQNNRAYTQVERLDEAGRVKELARIISGDKITELALANAREMLKLART
ncbi:MAG: DNA repair protein RecN [Pygmaiobacter massiliensis]|nr:DNA repair protein RecN [Pygmaiobacter massiliensis]